MGGQGVRMFSLILIAAVTHIVTPAEKKMDMSPNAVDDTFSGCREKMLQKVLATGGLLETEMKAATEFPAAWRGKKQCGMLIPGGTQQHTAALVVYGNGGKPLRINFNNAVETKGGNVSIYSEEFQFKSLHFLLTDALRLLNNGSECRTVFRASEKQYKAEVGAEVRFGRFTSAMAKRSEAVEDCGGGWTLFNITSCSVVNLETHACITEDIEQLISPVEVFKVEDVKVDPEEEEECHTTIVLTHSRFHSSHDCYLFPRSPSTTTTTTTTTTNPSLPGSSTHKLSSSLLVLLAVFLCVPVHLD